MTLPQTVISKAEDDIVRYTVLSCKIIEHLRTYGDDERVTADWEAAEKAWLADPEHNPVLMPARGESPELFLAQCNAVIDKRRVSYTDHIRAIFAASAAVQAISFYLRFSGSPSLSRKVMKRAGDEVNRRTQSPADLAESQAMMAAAAREGAPVQRIGQTYTWCDSCGQNVEFEIIDYSANTMKEGGIYEIQYIGRNSPELLSSSALDRFISDNHAALLSVD